MNKQDLVNLLARSNNYACEITDIPDYQNYYLYKLSLRGFDNALFIIDKPETNNTTPEANLERIARKLQLTYPDKIYQPNSNTLCINVLGYFNSQNYLFVPFNDKTIWNMEDKIVYVKKRIINLYEVEYAELISNNLQ